MNGRDEKRETPLIEAALADQPEAAAALIEAGADIEARNDRGFTALHAAAYSGSPRIATLLLDHGAAVDARSMHKITPLHVAAEQNQAAVAELLIARGADVEAIQGDGYTPLSRATFYKSAAGDGAAEAARRQMPAEGKNRRLAGGVPCGRELTGSEKRSARYDLTAASQHSDGCYARRNPSRCSSA